MTSMSIPEKKKKKSSVGPLIFRIVIILVAGLTVGLSVFSWNAQRLVGNQLPMPFGFGASVVLSGSMEPTLHIDDLVFVTEQDTYENDDIVVYQNGSMLVIHRIISMDGEEVVTKGDANNAADDPIDVSQIKGKLSFRIPYIGIVIKYIKTVPGTILILALAIFLMYRSRRKEKDKDRDELEKIVAEIRRLQEQNTAEQADAPQPEPINTAVPPAEPESESSSAAETDAALEAEPATDIDPEPVAEQDAEPVSEHEVQEQTDVVEEQTEQPSVTEQDDESAAKQDDESAAEQPNGVKDVKDILSMIDQLSD